MITSEKIEKLILEYADANTCDVPGFPKAEVVEDMVRLAVEAINLGTAGSGPEHQAAREIVRRFFDVREETLRDKSMHSRVMPLVEVCSMVSAYALQSATAGFEATLTDVRDRIPLLRHTLNCGICETCTGICAG